MYIRSREDALDALGVLLELPERRSQIVQSTVKVALCMTADTRSFMLDVQAGILSGGLDGLKERRRAAMEKLTETTILRKAPGVNVKTDALLEPIGQALDLLKMVDILVSTFPLVAIRHPKWELARFIHENASYVREAVEAGMRRRGKPEHPSLEGKVLTRVETAKPWWPEWASPIKEACYHYVRLLSKEPGDVHPTANDPEVMFLIVTMSEDRAQEVLRRLVGTGTEVLAWFRELRARVDLVLTAQAKADA
jgi:hypothetical protein